MIPLKDNLRYGSFAWVSVTIFALNVLMYIGQITLDTNGLMQTTISSWLPVRDVLATGLAEGDPWLISRSIAAVFLAMFLHGSFAHIFGNLWFFFAFAPALEARMGHGRFLAFYLMSGVMATLAFIVTDTSGVAHILGASGAIGGVLGAYVLYFPRARVDGMTPTFNLITTLAVFFLGEYLIMQWFALWSQLGGAEEAAGVAFSAHIGGMAFGMVAAAYMLVSDVGRLRARDLSFYGIVAMIACAAVFMPIGLGAWTILALSLTAVLTVWLVFFQNTAKGWWKRLGTPVATMAVAFMGATALKLSLAAWAGKMGLMQSLNIYGAAMLVMLATVVIAVAARRLPVVVKPKVICPVPKTEDRMLSEVAADLIVGACRYVGGRVSHLSALARAAMTAAAAFYRRHAPAGLQQRLDRVALAASRLVLVLRLDRVAQGPCSLIQRVRNRLVVTRS